MTNSTIGTFERYEVRLFSGSGNPPFFLVGQTNGLLAAWRNVENAEIHIQLPASINQSIPGFEFLSLDIAQNHESSPSLNAPGTNKDLSIQLNFGTSAGPQVRISDYGTLHYPIVTSSGTKSVKQTIRIPWKDLFGETKPGTNVTEIVLKFNRHNSGLVSIDEIQLTN